MDPLEEFREEQQPFEQIGKTDALWGYRAAKGINDFGKQQIKEKIGSIKISK